MSYESPRNAEELQLQELQAERSKLQKAIKAGKPKDTYGSVADMVERLRAVNRQITALYIKCKGL